MALGPKLGLSIDIPFLCYGGLFLGQPTHMYDRIEQAELISQEVRQMISECACLLLK